MQLRGRQVRVHGQRRLRLLTGGPTNRLSPRDDRSRAEAGGAQAARRGRRNDRFLRPRLRRTPCVPEPEFCRRFAREVEAARRVGRFYTAHVVDADTDADPPWLASAYVPGPSLEAAVRRHGPLPDRALGRLVSGLAEGLVAVHERELVHRDLKPGNVLLAADGPRLIDFGIAQAAQETRLTGTGLAIGTPGFMAPAKQPIGGWSPRTRPDH
ncbi:protein kinase domain-containing protein [Streptomyces tendae]|uniref:protein kinase domain-containing protein n=1 Tax=Streptomyces tendae TaxID=1932 RepID=UPI003F4B1B41